MSDESPASETDRTEAPGDKSGPPGEGFGSRFNKKLLTLGATVTALVGIVGGIAALRDEAGKFLPGSSNSPTAEAVADTPGEQSGSGGDTAAKAAGLNATSATQLEDSVQLTRYESLLGPAQSASRVNNGDWLVSTWSTPDIHVAAYSDRDGEVQAYTLTSLGPGFTPLIPYLPASVRLRESVFADLPEPTGWQAQEYPGGRWSFAEFHSGGTATKDRSLVLAANESANAYDRALERLSRLDGCAAGSIFDEAPTCDPTAVELARESLHITSYTVGSAEVLGDLERDGVVFHPFEYR